MSAFLAFLTTSLCGCGPPPLASLNVSRMSSASISGTAGISTFEVSIVAAGTVGVVGNSPDAAFCITVPLLVSPLPKKPFNIEEATVMIYLPYR